VAADLLVPPLGLAALERALCLSDVGGELVLLRAELLLELGHCLLAGLELVERDLDVALVAGRPLVEHLLALVKLPRPVAQARFGLRQPLLALANTGEGRLGDLGLLCEPGLALVELLLAGLELLPQSLAGHELLLASLQLLSQPIQLVALRLLEVRLSLGDLRLLGDELLLAGLDLAEALVELFDLVGRRGELLLELGRLRADPFLPVVDVCLTPPERGILGGRPGALFGEALLAFDEPRLAAGEILVPPVRPGGG